MCQSTKREVGQALKAIDAAIAQVRDDEAGEVVDNAPELEVVSIRVVAQAPPRAYLEMIEEEHREAEVSTRRRTSLRKLSPFARYSKIGISTGIPLIFSWPIGTSRLSGSSSACATSPETAHATLCTFAASSIRAAILIVLP